MRTAENLKIEQNRMLDALKKSRGVIRKASRECGVDRHTHKIWREKYPEYNQKCKDIGEMAIDFAEESLFAQIDEQNTAATIFFLKTRGKSRGYVENDKTQVSLNKKTGVISIGFSSDNKQGVSVGTKDLVVEDKVEEFKAD